MHQSKSHLHLGLLSIFAVLVVLSLGQVQATASQTQQTLFLPLIHNTAPPPHITLFNAHAETFPPPYGYGLSIEYEIDNLDDIPGRVPDYVTTQYSPDGGKTWYTDEAQRPPHYRWDNIHGDETCGATNRNLLSGQTYTLRVILSWHNAQGSYQTTSETTTASTAEYDCQDLDVDEIPDPLEQSLAETYFPHLWARWQISDRQQFYPYYDNQGWTIPFTVTPFESTSYPGYCDEAFQCLQIRYGLAYLWDCGDNPGNGCSGFNNHLGDSEFYAILLSRLAPEGSWGTSWDAAKEDVDAWRQVVSITFAHWGSITDSSRCHYYTSPRESRATLFVAEGKHATYHSVSDCDDGGFFGSDYCVDEASGGIDLRADLDAVELQNAGNAEEHYLFDTTIIDPQNPNQDIYDVWQDQSFGDGGSFYGKFTPHFSWDYLWWYNSPGASGCGDLCSCRSGD